MLLFRPAATVPGDQAILAGLSVAYLTAVFVTGVALTLGWVGFVFCQPWKSSHWEWRAAAPVLLAAWSGATLLFFLETGFALFYDTTDSFSLVKTTQRWNARHVRLNNWKLRDPKPFTAQPTGAKRRLAVLGDSFTFGHGVRNVADRFSDRLGRRLEQAQPNRWEVYNLGQPGAGVNDYLAILAQLKERGFAGDYLLLAYCLNDIEDLVPDHPLIMGSILCDYPNNRLLNESYLLNFLYFRYRQFQRPEVRGYFNWLADGYSGPVWEKQQRRLDQIQTVCADLKFKLLMVIFPFLHNLGPEYRFEAAHQALAAYCARQAIPCLDLLPVLRAHRDESLVVNRYDAHPNERAHALAAEAIWQQLLRPQLERETAPASSTGSAWSAGS